jgi:hypothetical protein
LFLRHLGRISELSLLAKLNAKKN